jgi:imidazolonepropionase-like amidohydrolase
LRTYAARDGRITAVSVQDGTVAPGARHIDLPGMTLLPGLIDMHVHLTVDPRFGGYKGYEFTDNSSRPFDSRCRS